MRRGVIQSWRRKRDAGQYDKRMTLYSPTLTPSRGTVTQTGTEVAKMWCKLQPVQGGEYWDAQQVQSSVTHRVWTWYRSDVSPTAKMWLTLGSRRFEIVSVVDVDEAHEEWEFRVVET